MPRRLVILLAVTCGAAAANLYYAQPLLDLISDDLGVSHAAAGLLVTASQLGFAAGLLFVVPLGDLAERRKLVTRMLLLAVVGLALATVAPGLAVLALGVAIAGLASTGAQILIAMAGDLAEPAERGRVVGTIMSGLLLGILLARTVSGLLAEIGGWRLPFGVGAGVMAVLALVLWRTLPPSRGASILPYPALLRSVWALVAREPTLRLRMAYGALGMASFTMVWTSLSFLLSEAPFGYGEGAIGLFGLAGVVGALAAQGAGRLADRGLGHAGTGAFWLATALAWVLLLIGGNGTVLVLIAGLLLLDLGIQGQHILNQSTIYALAPEARSRVTTAYMTSIFVSASISSAIASVSYDAGGWHLVCAMGGALAVAALGLWSVDRLRARRVAPVLAETS